MQKLLFILIGVILIGCKSTGELPVHNLAWEEKGELSVPGINPGVQVFENSEVIYKRAGTDLLNVKLSQPVVIDSADQHYEWGFFQFPKIGFTPDGKLAAQWNMAKDAVESYGMGGYQRAVSGDGGKTWGQIPKTIEPAFGLRLSNGEYLSIHRPKALDIAGLKLPAVVDSARINQNRAFVFYSLHELPEALQGVYFYRLPQNSNTWVYEHSKLVDKDAVRYADNKLFPVMWFGDMRVDKDGELYAGIYPGFHKEPDGKVKASGVFFYRSVNNGQTWEIQGRIPYQPDVTLDSNGNKRKVLGFTEPAFEILQDGSFICIMRTSDGMGYSPMYISRSVDKGKTWSKPLVFTQSGVLPRVLQLQNGVTVLASGRPGVQLRFSNDGIGGNWTDPFEMLPFDTTKIRDHVSCGYPDLVATGPDRCLLIYSDFKFRNSNGEFRKAIKVREIVVTPVNAKK